MSFFQKSVLTTYLENQDHELLEKQYKIYADYFLNKETQENIRSINEEQFQATFLEKLFVNALNYTLKPSPNFNLLTEHKNQKNAKKADGAVVFDNKTTLVIELKDLKTTDLSKVENQAFGYKNNQKDCSYVVICNFQKLRFFIDNAIEHFEFDLFNLSFADFAKLYLCLSKESIKNDLPKKIKHDSIVKEDEITESLYHDYSNFKRSLFESLCVKNPDKNQLELFKKSQKLIDRFLFIFFAEDKQLLPPNSIPQIINQFELLKDNDAYSPLYHRYKMYFNHLNQGRDADPKKGKAQIFAYNGGLFKKDELLDSLKIDDDLLLEHTKRLSAYDFNTDVNVNILGHIFENSLNELEEIKDKLNGKTTDKKETKRKKDGVFYTPKFITKYLIQNTLGKLCQTKKSKLEIFDANYTFSKTKGKSKAAILAQEKFKNLEIYRSWLLELTICDPSCGSGAFLNEALNFLITEHEYIAKLEYNLTGTSLPLADIENAILENNLYGVDINIESIEIAKLSLWLRTAQKGRKLTSLSTKLKCGNSLISDNAFALDAFNWQENFPEIFKNGGFDVILGNPPYVQLQKIKEQSKILSAQDFASFSSMGDLYCLFYERGNQLLKTGGILGYITSNKWLRAGYGKTLRKYLLENTKLLELIDLGSGIFKSATVDSNLLIFEKSKTKEQKVLAFDLSLETDFVDFSIYLDKKVILEDLNDDVWAISSPIEMAIKKKIERFGVPLKNWNIQINRGILTGYNEAFIITKEQKEQLIKEDPASTEIIKPILRGRDIGRYHANFADLYLINSHNGYKNNDAIEIEKYPAVKNHLDKSWDKISKRGDKGKTPYNLRNCAYLEEFAKEKIVYSEIVQNPQFFLDKNNFYTEATGFLLTGTKLNYLITLLNSKPLTFFFKTYYMGGGLGKGFRYKKAFLVNLPVVKPNSQNEKFFAKQTNLMQDFYQQKTKTSSKFLNYLKSKFSITKLATKLQYFSLLEFDDFIKELNKAIKNANKELIKQQKEPNELLSKKNEMDWLEIFEDKKSEILELDAKIAQNDREINQKIYQLYELDEQEIKFIEQNC